MIAVSLSSQYLCQAICNAGGDTLINSYESAYDQCPEENVIVIDAVGCIRSKRIYFLQTEADDDQDVLEKSLANFVSNTIDKAIEEGYQSIAFPAIGCGQSGCSIATVAQAMIRQAYHYFIIYDLSISFIIQPEQADVFHEFRKQLNLFKESTLSTSETIGSEKIEIEQGYIVQQKVDVIIITSSSQFLTKAILKVAGNKTQLAYETELQHQQDLCLVNKYFLLN